MSENHHQNKLPQIFDRKALVTRLLGEETAVDMFVGNFCKDMELQFAKLGELLSGEDCDPIRRQAHLIRGASGHIGAMAMNSAAQALELAASDGKKSELENFANRLKNEFNLFKNEVTHA